MATRAGRCLLFAPGKSLGSKQVNHTLLGGRSPGPNLPKHSFGARSTKSKSSGNHKQHLNSYGPREVIATRTAK